MIFILIVSFYTMAPKRKTAAKNARETRSQDTHTSYAFPDAFMGLSDELDKQYFKPTPVLVVSDQIVVIDKFLPPGVCNELIRSFETNLTLETTPLVKSKGYAVRVNDRVSLPNSHESSTKLWSYLSKILLGTHAGFVDEDQEEIIDTFEDAIGLNPQLRVYRYRKGHHFGKHYDEAVLVDNPKGKTRWTLLVYLTGDDEFEGGGTIFYPSHNSRDAMNIHPSKGMALLHKHGDDCLQHEAELVKSGEKWVLRSDVVY